MTPVAARDRIPWDAPGVGVAVGATLVFVVLQIVAAVQPKGALAVVSVSWSLVLFVAGAIGFLAAFVVAAGRSRDEVVTMSGVVWLVGTAPRMVGVTFRVLLGVQIVVALAAAAARPFTALAFGILAPMFGLGCLAWHGARHGDFVPVGVAASASGSDSAGIAEEMPDGSPGGDSPAPTSAQASRVAPVVEDNVDPDDFDQLFRRRRRRRGD